MLHLYLIPLIFALIGLAFYTVLGGADFGAGFWQLTAGTGPQAQAVREHAHAAMAPVWEANHVWLIFVLTVVWTAYPTAFGSIASTLSITEVSRLSAIAMARPPSRSSRRRRGAARARVLLSSRRTRGRAARSRKGG